MNLFLALLGVAAIAVFGFIVTHCDPLVPCEIRELAHKRRWKSIRSYFSFDGKEYLVNKDFKKRMDPKGTFYSISVPLFQFPSLAAGLLKSKKHEWIIVAFERDSIVSEMWLNKGEDRNAVRLLISVGSISQIATQKGYTSVLVFHNHPNAVLAPSSTDVETAKAWAEILNRNGITLVEFICGRGLYREYCFSPSDQLYPLQDILAGIESSNGKSWIGNLALHFERVFG